MKKAVLLIAALLMVGSVAFSAPSFGIWGRTVFQLAGGRDDVDDVIYQGWGPSWLGPGPRMGLHATFSNDKMEFKFTFYMNYQVVQDTDNNDGSGATSNGPGAIDPVNCYGTLKFIPDLLTVLVGRFDGDGWDNFRKNTANPNSDLHNDDIGRFNGWGVIVSVAPADTGFEAALYMQTPAPNAYYSSVPFYAGFDLVEDQLQNISIAASYKLPDLLKISLGWVNKPGSVKQGAGYYQDNNIFARIELLMVENLTLWVDGRIWGLAGDDNMQMQFVLCAAYKMDALGIYLGAKLGVPPTGNDYISYAANLEVAYDLGAITIGLIGILEDDNSDFESMKFAVKPYVSLDDFGTRIAFEYISDGRAATTVNYWAIPIYFTFSIW